VATAKLAASGRIAEMPVPPSVLAGPRGSTPRASVSDASGVHSPLALGPTSLAQPSITHRSSIASLVGASFGGGLKSAPSGLTPRLAVVLAAALAGVVLSVVLVVTASDHGGASPAPTVLGSGSTRMLVAPPPTANSRIDEEVNAALVKIDKGDFASAI